MIMAMLPAILVRSLKKLPISKMKKKNKKKKKKKISGYYFDGKKLIVLYEKHETF